MKPAKSVIEFHKKVKLQKKNETRDDNFKKERLPRGNVYIEDDFDASKPTFGISFHFFKIRNANPMSWWQHRNCSFMKMKPHFS